MSLPFRPVEVETPASSTPAAATSTDRRRLTSRIAGKTPVLLLWLIGIPIPIIVIIFLLKGCS